MQKYSPKKFQNIIRVPGYRFLASPSTNKIKDDWHDEKYDYRNPFLLGEADTKVNKYLEYFKDSDLNTQKSVCEKIYNKFDDFVKEHSQSAVALFSISRQESKALKQLPRMMKAKSISMAASNGVIKIFSSGKMKAEEGGLTDFEMLKKGRIDSDFSLSIDRVIIKHLWLDTFQVRVGERGLIEFYPENFNVVLYCPVKLET